MTFAQVKVPGVKPDGSPAATTYNSAYVLAWTKDNNSIWWTALQFDTAQDTVGISTPSNSGLSTQGGYGPALTNFNGVLWMAFLENPDQAPLIPPSTQRKQPPVIMVSELDGTSWLHPRALWDPGLTGSDVYTPYSQGPAAMSAPAIAASASEILVAWVEYAIDGSDSLVPPAGVANASKTAQPQIFFAKRAASTHAWTQRSAVSGALTQATPALTAANGFFYMAWQGHSDTSIWFARYSDDKGWSATAKLPGVESSAGPALGTDSAGNVKMVWKGKSDSTLYLATLGASANWSPHDPGKGWSSHQALPVIGTGAQPALASQLAAFDLSLAYTGTGGSDLWVVPLSSFAVVPAPHGGLDSSNNYLLVPSAITLNNPNNCPPLPGASVTIDITEDIVVVSDSPAASGQPQVTGCSFQMNCYSQKTWSTVFQQYVIALNGNALQGVINNWASPSQAVYNTPFGLTSVPRFNVLPKGYKLNITLSLASGATSSGAIIPGTVGLVIGAIFTVWDEHGHQVGYSPQTINLSPQQLAPIVAFELDIIGPADSEHAVFSSGAGTITYACLEPATQLFAMNAIPACSATGGGTTEKGNTVYGSLTVYPSDTIKQSFHVKTG